MTYLVSLVARAWARFGYGAGIRICYLCGGSGREPMHGDATCTRCSRTGWEVSR